MSDHYYIEHKSQRITKKLRRFFLFLITIIVLLGGWVLIKTFLFVKPAPEMPTSSEQTRVQTPSIKIFRSAFFQFQASDSWIEDAKATKENVFVYRSFRGPLVEHDLTIYINPMVGRLEASRVLPIEVSDNGFIVPDRVSDHCRTAPGAKDGQDSQQMSWFDVSFLCDIDGTNYTVIVGRKGANTTLQLLRPDNTSANYIIYYRNLRANPDGQELESIVKTFQTR